MTLRRVSTPQHIPARHTQKIGPTSEEMGRYHWAMTSGGNDMTTCVGLTVTFALGAALVILVLVALTVPGAGFWASVAAIAVTGPLSGFALLSLPSHEDEQEDPAAVEREAALVP